MKTDATPQLLLESISPKEVRRDTNVGARALTVVTARLNVPWNYDHPSDHCLVAGDGTEYPIRVYGSLEQLSELHDEILATGKLGQEPSSVSDHNGFYPYEGYSSWVEAQQEMKRKYSAENPVEINWTDHHLEEGVSFKTFKNFVEHPITQERMNQNA